MGAQEDPDWLRSTFDGVAALYDEIRPGYPERLFEDLESLAGAGSGSKVLEIGCGTGQATVYLASRGYHVLAVELGENLAEIARSKVAIYPDTQVLTLSFEDWPLGEEAFDLVVSATAFHWVDPEIRYKKSAKALLPGGSLALMWNRPEPEESTEGFQDALREVHRREAPELSEESKLKRLDRAADKADDIERSGFFERPTERHYRFGVSHDAESYLQLLSTYSSHRALDEATKQRLFAAVTRLIDEAYGGSVVEGYRCELYIARRRCRRAGNHGHSGRVV